MIAPEPSPLPPDDLASRPLSEIEIPTDDVLHRFFSATYDPIFFDRGLDGRLNSPCGAYGVLYAAREPAGAFAETFLRVPGRTLLPLDLLNRKAYVKIRVKRPLKMVRMSGNGLARMGATAQVVHGGKPYDAPQAWSSALFDRSDLFDGIAYNARHDDEALCYAIFDRAQDAIEELDRTPKLDEDWFWELADAYGVGLAPQN